MKLLRFLILVAVISSGNSVEIPNIDGRWNMDTENIRKLLNEHKAILTTDPDSLIKELIEDKESGKDVVFKGDMVAFVNENKLVRRYKMRLFIAGDNSLRIEIFNTGPTEGMVRILDIQGDQMVFRDPGYQNKFDMFRAYKRIKSE